MLRVASVGGSPAEPSPDKRDQASQQTWPCLLTDHPGRDNPLLHSPSTSGSIEGSPQSTHLVTRILNMVDSSSVGVRSHHLSQGVAATARAAAITRSSDVGASIQQRRSCVGEVEWLSDSSGRTGCISVAIFFSGLFLGRARWHSMDSCLVPGFNDCFSGAADDT